ncbi:MAG: hypothetical protein UW79_C0015G0008 [Candidatus Yanofskybacteria bacterium GW2011_GWA2_44_9]|uniref:Uncharacterized protein n=2 Tax=Candidatus Yanofskyibacteriota TaxID=1752733 RepID=A0A0G1NC47_9BACT|nr:MAG: hypothetical protein UW79_C0015G0008 [Candidatus Yanofskybacteria bacterium GW2011_GWA2_44_9]
MIYAGASPRSRSCFSLKIWYNVKDRFHIPWRENPMDWRIVSAAPCVLWAIYVVFGSLANRAHGEKVSMVIEAVAMAFVGVVVLLSAGFSDFKRATVISISQASIMALASAIGLLVQFYAFRVAPAHQQGMVAMIGGMYPVLAVALFHGMYLLNISGGISASPRQWLGVACGALTLWLVSGK